ncbi:S9 family peptidase [Sphingomonas sp. 1P06PA]|uniref:alpha/beta hydrolase family protein n=1 Tax=Sphingomonas sp. 1P06PA TaxID=554121 RepID=UPI0039A658B0
MLKQRLALGAAAMALLVAAAPDDMAAKFGALDQVNGISLSPDGTKLAYIGPRKGKGNTVYTVDLANPGQPKVATAADGNPLVIDRCGWVSNVRLACQISALQRVQQNINAVARGATMLARSTRVIAVDADGSNIKMLSDRPSENAEYRNFGGGWVLDWLPGDGQAVMMARWFVPESRVGSLVDKMREGLGVERIDVTTGKRTVVEQPRVQAVEYITDGRGTVRIMGTRERTIDGYSKPTINYLYRPANSREWLKLSSFDTTSQSGFNPYAVDPERNLVYGLKKLNGRQALYSITLDDNLTETLVYANPQVDVDGVATIGRNLRVVGANYTDDSGNTQYFDKDVAAMRSSLSKALPGLPQVQVIDASLDASKMLLWAGSDVDPGNYFLFDRSAKKLQKLMLARPQLAGVPLAAVKPITYRTTDGTQVPAYLTLPVGKTKNLPTIVMPHGGPSARDSWGFDWLAQYYAARGYAVLQPNYRGSAGYGDDWLKTNAFKSWRSAIGDVVDAGKWLVSEGIADPGKLAIVGWSYGGYAALQSAVIAPDLYKAVVAIAPVTDFNLTIEENRGYSNFYAVKEFVNTPDSRAASPLQNAATIKAPVFLAHGDMDQNVEIKQSREMADRLRAAGKKHELIVYPGLAHSLETAEARTDLLAKSDTFLRASMGM